MDRLMDRAELDKLATVEESDLDAAKQDWQDDCPDGDYLKILDAEVV